MRYSITVISKGLLFRRNLDVSHVMRSTTIPVFISSLNTSNHTFAALETGPSLISLLIYSSSLSHCSHPYASVMLMLACCLAWDFCTDLILLWHVRYVLRVNLQFIGTCRSCESAFSPAVHELMRLLFFHSLLCCVSFTNHSSCIRICWQVLVCVCVFLMAVL